MKKIIVVILVLMVGVITAQNRTDSKGKQGVWVVKDDQGHIRYKGQFKDNQPIGKFTYYYPTGEPSSVMNFSDNGQKAECKMYHKNGNLMAVGRYIDRKKDSVWWFFNENKQVLKKETYKNDKLDGEVVTYYPANPKEEKVLKFEVVHWKDGLYHGEWTQFFKDGKVKAHGFYKNGYLDGQVKWYYPSGAVETVGWYKHTLKNGFWKTFEPDGELKMKVYYLNDRILEGEELEKCLERKKQEKRKGATPEVKQP